MKIKTFKANVVGFESISFPEGLDFNTVNVKLKDKFYPFKESD
jgi:hypothetical protein